MENRSYNLNNIPQKYQFTSKERDIESGLDGINGYDYFGARYYNSRVANWTSIDPLFEKHIQFTPYNYVLGNPLVFFDPDGRQTSFRYMQTWKDVGGGFGAVSIGYAIKQIWNEIAPGIYDLIQPIEDIIVLGIPVQEEAKNKTIDQPYIESKGGKKQIWPDQFQHKKPKSLDEIDWSKGDQELADATTGKDAPRGPKTPNNEIKKWYREHRPQNRNISPATEDKELNKDQAKHAQNNNE